MSVQVQTRGTLLDDAAVASAIHHLAGYHTEEGVLSVYLDLDPDVATNGHLARLRALLEPLHTHTTDQWLQGRLEYEIEGAIQTVRTWRTPPARAVAMFFCGPGGLDTVFPLPVPVPAFARFARRPVLAPLIAALDEHRRYCVVLFDRHRARIISVMLGVVEDEMRLENDVARTTVPGWGPRKVHAHPRDGDLHAHATRVVEHLWAIERSRPIHGLLLAGDPAALDALRAVLPRSLARAVIDPIEIKIDTLAQDVAHRIVRIEQDAREREDGAIVARILEEREGDLSVKGWDPTLRAVSEGRVQLLLLAGDTARAGRFCPQDHFVTIEAASSCPACGAPLRPTEHVAEAAVRAVLLHDGQVRVLAPRAGESLQRFGIGATLLW